MLHDYALYKSTFTLLYLQVPPATPLTRPMPESVWSVEYTELFQLQAEAYKLKSISGAKVIVLSIGSKVGRYELEYIASEPYDSNIVEVQSYISLYKVEHQLYDASCSGQSLQCTGWRKKWSLFCLLTVDVVRLLPAYVLFCLYIFFSYCCHVTVNDKYVKALC